MVIIGNFGIIITGRIRFINNNFACGKINFIQEAELTGVIKFIAGADEIKISILKPEDMMVRLSVPGIGGKLLLHNKSIVPDFNVQDIALRVESCSAGKKERFILFPDPGLSVLIFYNIQCSHNTVIAVELRINGCIGIENNYNFFFPVFIKVSFSFCYFLITFGNAETVQALCLKTETKQNSSEEWNFHTEQDLKL